MSGRLLTLVLVLAVISAAVGAGIAFLLRPSDDAAQAVASVAVVATTDSESDAVQDAAQEPTTAQSSETEQAASQEQPQPSATETSEAVQSAVAEQEVSQQVEQPEQAEQAVAEPIEQDDAQQEVESEEATQAAQVEPEPRFVATIAPDTLTQGEAMALTVESDEATVVAATVGSRSWNLSEVAPGVWWAVIAIPRDAEAGASEVVIDLYGEGGAWLRSLSESFVVLASTAPFEAIILGGSGPALDPVEVQRDVNVRFVEHTAVTGPPRWDGPWILPVEGEVTGVFGAKRSYDGVVGDEWHHGHDIAAQHGDPLVAPAPGTVVWTGELVLHGMGVIIDHGAGVYSGYWHMSLIAVREGFELEAGDWLGNIGTTGLSTGPHLHWEVIVQGVDVDPVQWLGEERPPLPLLAQGAEQSADTLQ